MEEDIKVLEEFIENYNASYPEEEEWVVIYPNQVQAIQGLLDLYNKEKEKNKELEEDREKYIIRLTDKQYRTTMELFKNDINNKWRDKIREKIKIRKEEKSECTDSIEASLLLREIYVLQELLEE